MLATIALLAIVTLDQASLRAAPRDAAQQQAVLWQGDSLEIRGQKADYLQVYDHRRERAGYIKASQVRLVSLQADDAQEALAVVRFLRDTPGAEALGISYTAAFLKAAPASAIGPEAFDALGSMAERLARRASSRKPKQDDGVVAAHLEVVAQYGVNIHGYERDGRMRLCYDGEAFRRVLALNASNEQKARAALALTRQDCIDPAMRPSERNSLDLWRAEVLDKVTLTDVPEYLKNRLHMRRAGVWSSIAYQRTRKGDAAAEAAAQRALQELAGVNKTELTDEDGAAYSDAAMRVGATRWAAETAVAAKPGLNIVTSPGQPGETCVALIDAAHPAQNPLVKRCSYGVVWTASARANAGNTALSLAVQPMDGWRELWLFHQGSNGWIIDVLPPAISDPDLGYVEFAGWIPGVKKLLVAREVKVDGRFKRSFDVVNMDSLQVENSADKPGSLNVFYKWQDAVWKRQSVMLR
ncbi:MAG: hypothetical protein V4805_06620 [Pseudomonadota bacterium]